MLHAHADDQDARVPRRHHHRLVDHAGHADSLEDDERLRAVDAPPCVHRTLDRGVDDLVRTHLRGERAPCRREVGRDDRLDAAPRELVDHREADRAAPEHDRGVALSDVRLRDRVDADRERLGEGGVSMADAVRHLHRDEIAEQHELAVATRELIRVPDRVEARLDRTQRASRRRHRPSSGSSSRDRRRGPRRRTHGP